MKPTTTPGAVPLVVLIVDDDARNRKLVRDVLAHAGLGTLEAASGAEALALGLEHSPDVVLMDLRLPDMDGTDALRRLRADRRTAGIPVVALTAVADARETLLAAGFAAYVEKPIDALRLPAVVRRHARSTRLARDRAEAGG